ncbi:hypothetical protein DSM112329_04194 [Paraconexibacter sp. AEG42_29]|uniref:Lipid/polyisoprenoid-binding YceI-like domain-containing protein n=1 Tax=Paraconexibacter sp. AEG42_29 TaxID=2997339 RepID=A0AAU7B035_9ACTN
MPATSSAPTPPSAALLLPDGHYRVDGAASTVRFAVAHFRVQTVRGTLTGLTGEVTITDGRLVARGSVDATTVRTGTPPRDAHLRSFLLRTADHPQIELRVDSAPAPEVAGILWIRGRPVMVLVSVTADTQASRLRAGIALDRRAAGLTWPAPIEAGGVAVGRTVTVELDLALQPA